MYACIYVRTCLNLCTYKVINCQVFPFSFKQKSHNAYDYAYKLMYVHMIDQLAANKSTINYVSIFQFIKSSYTGLLIHKSFTEILAVIWLPNFVGSHCKIKIIKFYTKKWKIFTEPITRLHTYIRSINVHICITYV